MSTQEINIVITPYELLHSIVPEIDIAISKGLLVRDRKLKKPLGTVEKWVCPKDGCYHIKQVINNEH